MMINKFITILVLAVFLVFTAGGCAYVNIKAPFDTDLSNTELGSKKGTAQAHSLLWLVAWGDASYASAAKNGNITVIKHADQKVFHLLLGVYSRWTVIVYGD